MLWSRRWRRRAPSAAIPASIGSAALRERRRGLDAAALRRVARRGAARRVRGHQGVRGQRGVVPAAAHPGPRHRAGPGRWPTPPMPWGPGWPAAGWWRCPPRPDGESRLWRPSPTTTPGGPCACGSTARPTPPARSPTWERRRPGAGRGRARALRRVLRRVHLGPRRRPPSCSTGTDGVVAVHSLSKRSNLAGAARRVLRRRRRAGRVPGRDAQARRAHGAGPGAGGRRGGLGRRRPCRGATPALSPPPRPSGRDPARARARAWRCPPAASTCGCRRRPGPRRRRRRGAWRRRGCSEALAESAGMLVSPGEFYGDAGGGVRAYRRGPARRPHRAGGDAPGGVGPPRPDRRGGRCGGAPPAGGGGVAR